MTQNSTVRPLALVTGASSGIGLSLARQFAEHGFDLIVAAEDDELQGATAELRSYGVEVTAVQGDLASPLDVDHLNQALRASGRPLAAAALNAGVGVSGPLLETELEGHLRVVDLNVRSTVHLAKLLVEEMVAQGEGRLLFTSSIAAVGPNPYQSTYGASKAFVQSFAMAIREELKDTGVTVTALMPGPTDTEFFERADMLDTRIGAGPKDDPDDVARDGYEALMAGKASVVAGSLKNRVQAELGTHAPDTVAAAVMARMTEPGSASD
jgi:uncharacterized protein